MFGNPVATFTGQARLTMAGGVCRGASCWSSKPGAHEVTASVGARIAHAQLTVKSHKASGVVPAPEGSGSGTCLAPPGPATAARPDLPDRAPGAKNSAIDLLATSAGPGGPLPAIFVGLLCLTAATLRYRRRVAARPARTRRNTDMQYLPAVGSAPVFSRRSVLRATGAISLAALVTGGSSFTSAAGTARAPSPTPGTVPSPGVAEPVPPPPTP